MEKDKLQELLPEGLVLIKAIPNIQFSGVSFEAEDQRFPDLSISRVVTFLDRSNCNDWQKNWEVKFGERLKVLASTPMRHVVRPLEVTQFAGIDCVVTDQRDKNIKTLMHAADNVAEKLELFQQLLEGIEELHRQDIVHGAICADYVQYSRHTNNSIQCQLVSTEWGMVHAWAKGNGREINDDLKKYYPPEWNSGPEGSREGDVYAAGIIGCELFADAAKISVYKNDQQELRKDLRDKNLPKFAIKVICGLVSKNIQNIQDALEKCQKQPIPPLKIAIWSVVASCLLTSWGFWVMLVAPLQAQNNELNDSVARLEENLSDLRKKYEDGDSKDKLDAALLTIDALEAKIRELEGRPGSVPVEEEVDRIWKDVYDDPKTTLSSLPSKLVAEVKKSELKDPTLSTGLKDRYKDFQTAAIFWRKMALDGNLSLEAIKKKADLQNTLTDGALEFIRDWAGEYDVNTDKGWTIQLGKAVCKGDHDKERQMFIYVDGDEVPFRQLDNVERWDHNWKTGKAHDYSVGEGGDLFVKVPTGHSIHLHLESENTFYNDMIVEEDSICTGTLSMWRFHVKGQKGISNEDSETTLYLTVKDIAGPRWEISKPKPPINFPVKPEDILRDPEGALEQVFE